MVTTARVIVAGASGLIGAALIGALRADGVEVRRLVRQPAAARDEIEWRPGKEALDPETISGASAVVNLCGASIGRLPWTPEYRNELRDSRILPTRTLATAIRALAARGDSAPQLVNASAVGFAGSRPGVTITETIDAGHTFLARLCAEWEREALAAGEGADVALLRTAPVIHPRGVLKPLILLTRLGLSGPLAGGAQMWPWISLTDEVAAIRHVIRHRIAGPVNLAGPVAASADETCRELAKQMHRPYLVPVPAAALRLALGRDAADALLLADARVEPEVLQRSGFRFTHPTIQHAIAAALDA